MKHLTFGAALLLSFVPALGGCSGRPMNDETSATSEDALVAGRAGAVFTLSNDADSNEVIVFRRAADGSLQRAASYATSGKGSGDALGSQGALTFSTDGKWLFAVNAGSNELSVFRAKGETLYLVDSVLTGGTRPISVTEHDGLVYVLHGGDGHNDISGFYQRNDGTLEALPGSVQELSEPSAGPAQIALSPSGRAIVVTEKMTNRVDEFRIGADGTPSSVTAHDSNGQTPFGFAINNRGQVIVSEAFGGADDASAVTSYQLGRRSGLTTVSPSVADHEGAACWVTLAHDGRFAFVSNTKSGSISRYDVATDGTLTLADSDGRSADTGMGSKPADMATSRDERFLYVLETGTSSLGVFALAPNGSLSALPAVSGLPAAAVGLVAR